MALAAQAGAAARPGSERLSPRLERIARTPSLRAATPRGRSRGVGLPARGPGSLAHTGARITVEVRLRDGAALDRLRAAGARVLHLSTRYGVATVAVDPGALRTVGAVRGVRSVHEVLAPVLAGAAGAVPALNSCQGAVTSEGDTHVRANALRSALDVDGSGVKVGVLSDSYNRDATATTHAPGDVATGDLPGTANPCGHPTPVQVLDEPDTAESDEGRAMLQIVHDLAPGSDLAFATAYPSSTAFADNIRALRTAGSRVIVDDVAYADEPFFQDGPVATAVNEVAAAGVAYFSAAGNSNERIGGEDTGAWESPAFRDSGSCPAGELTAAGYSNCEDFDPGPGAPDTEFEIGVLDGGTLNVDLQWAQPWNGVTTDLDVYILDGAGNVLNASEEDNIHVSQQPFEFASWDNDTGADTTVQVAIRRDGANGDTSTPRLKFVLLGSAGISSFEYATPGSGDTVGASIFGHNGAAGAQSVAAVNRSTTGAPEPYSSRGPVTLLFGPVRGDGTPASPLAAPQVLAKPDVAATDCVHTTFFFGPSHVFCGTSAAAPHAAGVGALQLAATPSATAAEARAAQRGTASPVGSFAPEAVGGGLLNATAAAFAPDVGVTGPSGLSNDPTPTITFLASHVAAFACAIDGGPAQACNSPFTAPPLPDGSHSVTVTATDALGHSRTGAPVSFAIDATPPDTVITAGPSGATRLALPAFQFASGEPVARFECRYDELPFATCAGAVAPQGRLGDGAHSFEARAVDAAGNADPTPARRVIAVDTVRPRVRIARHPARATSSRRARFTFAVSERGTRILCRVDRKRFARCRSSRRVKVRPGSHRMQAQAVDAAGNRSRTASFRWRVRR